MYSRQRYCLPVQQHRREYEREGDATKADFIKKLKNVSCEYAIFDILELLFGLFALDSEALRPFPS